jgi:hypothetical protein
MSQTKDIVSRDRPGRGLDPQMCGVIQCRAESILAVQDQYRHSIDVALDSLMEKYNGVTVQSSTSRDTSKLPTRHVSGPFISSCSERTTPERMPRVPGQNKAVHGRGRVRESDPAVVQWKRHVSGRRRDHTAKVVTPGADDIDIDFTLLGDSSVDELYGGLF